MISPADAEKIRQLSAQVNQQCSEWLGFMATPIKKGRTDLNRELSTDEIDRIADMVTGFFSRTKFDEHFQYRSILNGWTIEQAVGMWSALGHLALVVAATKAYGGEQAAASRVVLSCEPQLRRHWAMPMGVTITFQSALEQTEPEALAALNACATGLDVSRFVMRYTDRILGVPVPLSIRDKSSPMADYLSAHAEPQGGLAFSHYVGLLFMELVESLAPLL